VRILGIDPGERRIGLAVSDEGGVLARPLKVVERRSWAEDLAEIEEVLKGLGVEAIVVGHPLNMDGSAGRQARRAERLAERLRESAGLPVMLYDERLSTRSALSIRSEAGSRGKRRREEIDAVAAAVILQDYLELQRER